MALAEQDAAEEDRGRGELPAERPRLAGRRRGGMHLRTGRQADPVAALAPGAGRASGAGDSEDAGWGRCYKPLTPILRSSDLPAADWETSDDFMNMEAWWINSITPLSGDPSPGTG